MSLSKSPDWDFDVVPAEHPVFQRKESQHGASIMINGASSILIWGKGCSAVLSS